MPQFSDDDVTNFMVMEALHARGAEDMERARKDREREDFRRSHKQFDPKNPRGG